MWEWRAGERKPSGRNNCMCIYVVLFVCLYYTHTRARAHAGRKAGRQVVVKKCYRLDGCLSIFYNFFSQAYAAGVIRAFLNACPFV